MFTGLPLWAQCLFSLTLAVIAVVQVWNLALWVIAAKNQPPEHDDTPLGESDFLWVFVVPALNEERTIADSVSRLVQMRCSQRRILVIDDGSEDATPEVLATLREDHPELVVLRRDPPNARLGKAASLNDAYRFVCARLADSSWADPGHDRVVFAVIDADGRLDPDCPEVLSARFADPRVAGVQVRVDIYNDNTPLTWCQDVEFSVYGWLYQAARSAMGVAGMGGNGQFNRLSALTDVDEGSGPWRDRLTEDQDIGMRFIEAGWRNGHDNTVSVSQQGVPNLRRLLRQRTRWAQGNLQAMQHITLLRHAHLGFFAAFDQLAALLLPLVQLLVGVSLASSLYLAVARGFSLVPGTWLLIAVFYTVGFGSMVLGCSTRYGRSPAAFAKGLITANAYVAYTWTIWPVLTRALWRQLRRETGWAKTAREVVATTGTPPETPGDLHPGEATGY